MSFQAYLDNIQVKTGQSPDDLRNWAASQGFTEAGQLLPAVKAGEIVAALKRDFALGHCHAMAVYALLKGIRKEGEA